MKLSFEAPDDLTELFNLHAKIHHLEKNEALKEGMRQFILHYESR